jgi:hypothetical protein
LVSALPFSVRDDDGDGNGECRFREHVVDPISGLRFAAVATVWLRARGPLFERKDREGRFARDPRSGRNFFNSPDQARGLRGKEVFSKDRVKLER